MTLATLDQFAETPFPSTYPPDHRTFNAPGDKCATACVAVIESVTKTQVLAMYSFTCSELVTAVVAKIKAGIPTLAVFDLSEFNNASEQRSIAPLLACIGMPNFRLSVGTAPDGHDISHWKIYIADEETCVTGSFNWTNSAQLETNQCTIANWPTDAKLFRNAIEAVYSFQITHQPQHQPKGSI